LGWGNHYPPQLAIYFFVAAHTKASQQPFAVVATSAGFRAGYDRNGNMLARVEVSGTQVITYVQEWTVENRLAVVTNTVTGDATRFVYDGDGNRIARQDPTGLTVNVGAVEVEISGTQRLTTTYYFAGGQRIAMRKDGKVTYLHGDHLGSASLATDASGAKVSAMRYTPFGETRFGDAPTDRRFTGQREEAGIGLYDYGARFYSASLGRFISADTIVPGIDSQALNRYTCVLNNPLNLSDPSGHDPIPGAYADGYFRGRASSFELVRFAGNWSIASRLAVIRGTMAIAKQLRAAVDNDQARAIEKAGRIGEAPEELSPLSSLWGLSEKKTFLAVYGQVTFRKVPQCEVVGCTYGVDPGAWGWSRVADLGEVWINESAAYTGFNAELNVVHELGHGLDQLGGGWASRNLVSLWANQPLQRGDGGFAGNFPWQQSTPETANTESEVFADTFVGWTYSRWGKNDAGKARSKYMQDNIFIMIALAVEGN